ncbi:MAG TPA: hypothetical protein VK694_04365 [Verrucomicrobiae bacterium]|nr:hypothetical protein [Verrucomicrobiae bacterium]
MDGTPTHRGHFAELPSGAQEHVDQLHPDLQQALGNRLMQLSHLEFYDLEKPGNHYPDPNEHYNPTRIELGEQHQPQVDRVSNYIETASDALHATHDALLEQGAQKETLSPDKLVAATYDRLLGAAAKEKDAGNREAAISTLETALIIDSLMYTDDIDDDRETVVHQAVVKGMADELIQATNNTFGLVSVTEIEPGSLKIVPATHNSQRHEGLLGTASSPDLDFNDNFSEIKQINPGLFKSQKEPLSSQDFLTLAEVAEQKDDPSQAKRYINSAFASQVRQPKNPDTAAALLIKAQELELPDLEDKIADLRNTRLDGMLDDEPTRSATAVNGAIPRLIQAGHEELAEGLISSSPREMSYSQKAVHETLGDSTKANHVLAAIADMHERKRQALVVALDAHGAPKATVSELLDSYNPDGMVSLTPEFWDEYAKMPPAPRVALGTLYAAESLHSPDEQLVFIRSAAIALQELAAIETPDNAASVAEARQLALTTFEQPAAALQTAKEIFGEDAYLSELSTLTKIFEEERWPLIYVTEDVGPALRDLKQCVNADQFVELAQQVVQKSNPQAAVDVVNVMSQLTANQQVFKQIITSEQPEASAAAYTYIANKLKERGESLDALGISALQQLAKSHRTDYGENGPEITVNDVVIERYVDWAQHARFDQEIGAAYETYWQARRDPEVKRGQELLAPQLADLPGIQEHLTSLGLDEQLASRLFETWRALDRFPKSILEDKDKDDKAKQEAFDTEFALQKEMMQSQVRALSKLIEAYSLQEATYMVETFGIQNFNRYKPEQLHKQFVDWTSGRVAPRNLVISAQGDHNSFMSNIGSEYTSQLKQEGLFFFEAGSATELAKIAVAVGQRERNANREPDLQNVIIAAHGEYRGLILGPRGEALSIFQYIHQINSRGQVGARPNTFTKHLGNSYRIILHACSTAGEGGIAYHMRDTHDRTISSASHRVVVGREQPGRGIVIEPDGAVYFAFGDDIDTADMIPATIYDIEQFAERA